jgi:hypothetical protein
VRPLNFTVRPPVKPQRYRLGLADGAYGPGDVDLFTVEACRIVKGPDLENWQPESLLAAVEAPFKWHGDMVRYVTLSPRGPETLFRVEKEGGIVSVGRVLPGHDPMTWTRLVVSGLEHWGVGKLTVLEV